MDALHNPHEAIGALLFASGEGIDFDKLEALLGLDRQVVRDVLPELIRRFEAVGLTVLTLEDRLQLVSHETYAELIKGLFDKRRSVPLTQAALEVLAIIAFNGPVSRGFIEKVRGVDSDELVRGLVKKELICEAGRLDLPGRPVAFKTTDHFLRCFGLSGLSELLEKIKSEEITE